MKEHRPRWNNEVGKKWTAMVHFTNVETTGPTGERDSRRRRLNSIKARVCSGNMELIQMSDLHQLKHG